MRYWIVPSNDNTFRIGDAIAAQDGMADWRTDKFSVGDIVFIYKTNPEKRIHYKMEVIKVKMIFDEAFEQEVFWTDKDQYYLESHPSMPDSNCLRNIRMTSCRCIICMNMGMKVFQGVSGNVRMKD